MKSLDLYLAINQKVLLKDRGPVIRWTTVEYTTGQSRHSKIYTQSEYE